MKKKKVLYMALSLLVLLNAGLAPALPALAEAGGAPFSEEIALDAWNFQYGFDFLGGPDASKWQPKTLPYTWYMHTMSTDPNIVSNPGFENGLAPWLGNFATVTLDTEIKHGGAASAKTSDRGYVWSAVCQDIAPMLNERGPGVYDASVWVSLPGASDIADLSIYGYAADGTLVYATLGSAEVGDGFARISGSANVSWEGSLSSMNFYVGTRNSLADLYLDDCSMVKQEPTDNLAVNPGFENGLAPWLENNCTVTLDADVKHSGEMAAKASNRAFTWSTVYQDVASVLNEKGPGAYSASAWASLPGDSDIAELAIYGNTTGGLLYVSFGAATLGDGFTELSGATDISWEGDVLNANFYVSTLNSQADLYVDDFSLTIMSVPEPVWSLDGVTASESAVTVSVTRGADSVGAIVILASYSADGRLLQLESKPADADGPYAFDAPPEGAAHIKAFVWDAAYVPLAPAYSMEYTVQSEG
jgi:hypothetical protein